MGISSARVRYAGGLLLAATMLGMAAERNGDHAAPVVYAAYYEQLPVELAVSPAPRGQRSFAFGPWRLGGRVPGAKPTDRRLNLYVVLPGVQHQDEDASAWDHNAIISAVPPEDHPREWDVFWAVVLDPALGRDLRSERDLLMAGQAGFRPGDLFEFDDLPGAWFLREYLKMHTLGDLTAYRRPDGLLPRVIIVPAGYAIRAGKA